MARNPLPELYGLAPSTVAESQPRIDGQTLADVRATVVPTPVGIVRDGEPMHPLALAGLNW